MHCSTPDALSSELPGLLAGARGLHSSSCFPACLAALLQELQRILADKELKEARTAGVELFNTSAVKGALLFHGHVQLHAQSPSLRSLIVVLRLLLLPIILFFC